jgi:oligopeptidase B
VLTGDFDSNVLRLYYESMTTPLSTIDHDMTSGKRQTKKVQPVLGGFAKEDYVTERHWVTASDGVEVPVSLVYRKGLAKLDGTDPCMLYG